MQSLEDLGLDKTTITIFLSDHGYLWGEHNIGGKWLLYEESIRTPIIIKDPGAKKSRQGLKLNQMALNIDIAPTILDLAGIPIPGEMDGTSLLPVMKDENAHLRDDFFMEHVGVIEVKTPIPDSRGVRTEEWKYIHYINVDPEVEEMYHLKDDPLESKNLINDSGYEQVKNDLKKRYNNYLHKLQK
jgi:arylsulfatase A-like enzyme